MIEEDDDAMVDELVCSLGLQHPVKISAELVELLKPNEFMTTLGVRYDERLKTVLSILKGNMAPGTNDTNGTLQKDGMVISFAVAKGPYIREEPVVIKAELINDGAGTEILLTAIRTEV